MGKRRKCGMWSKKAAKALAAKKRRTTGKSVKVVYRTGPGPCGSGYHVVVKR